MDPHFNCDALRSICVLSVGTSVWPSLRRLVDHWIVTARFALLVLPALSVAFTAIVVVNTTSRLLAGELELA